MKRTNDFDTTKLVLPNPNSSSRPDLDQPRATGHGVERDYFDRLAIDIQSTYFSTFGYTEKVRELDHVSLTILGHLIGMILTQDSRLIRLPLSLMVALGATVTDGTLEHIVYLRAPELLPDLFLYKDDPALIHYDTYQDYLHELCCIETSEIDMMLVASIGRFVSYSSASIVVYERTISPPAIITAKEALAYLTILSDDPDVSVDQIESIISTMTSDQLKQMFKNLTGYSVPRKCKIVAKRFDYSVEALDANTNMQYGGYGTCSEIGVVPSNLVSEPDQFIQELSRMVGYNRA